MAESHRLPLPPRALSPATRGYTCRYVITYVRTQHTCIHTYIHSLCTSTTVISLHTKVLEALDDSLTDVLSSAQRKKLLAYLKVDLLESALCSFIPCSGGGSCCGNRNAVGVDSCSGDGSGSGNRNWW